jgi:hypothetical protein
LRDGINRGLTVSLSEIGVSMDAEYNPGGVLPEVSSRSWMLFGSILVAILVLLVVPGLFNRGIQAFASSKPSKSRSRIKLDKPPAGNKEPGVRFK